ncbi:type II toxin-antitoxin system RelE/ParE family toxin [bacterium]|nr:type II toxin-antitoxin system RelE/ParE family toxin [bacterium]MBU1917952.1 type II toxin-antitoxin system RelE/ParE family toxin [bacterium]
MKYKIVFSPTAAKQFKKLPKIIARRIASAISKLAIEPMSGKRLKGELGDYWSYRVGQYRVIYYIRQKKIQIEIIRVAHRREVCR